MWKPPAALPLRVGVCRILGFQVRTRGHTPAREGQAERAPCMCARVYACLGAFWCVPVQACACVCKCAHARAHGGDVHYHRGGREGRERARKRPEQRGELAHILPPLGRAGAPTNPARACAGRTLSAHSGAPTDLPPRSPAPHRRRRFASPLAALTWAWAGPTRTDGVAAGGRLQPPAARTSLRAHPAAELAGREGAVPSTARTPAPGAGAGGAEGGCFQRPSPISFVPTPPRNRVEAARA